MNSSAEQDITIYTVSRLNSEAKLLLEEAFPFVWIEGEISNFAAPHSGHWYFSLKDATAQLKCAMFRMKQRKVLFTPKNGSHVLIKGCISLYENRGDYQLIAEDMEERGEGRLRQAFEQLKKKLHEEGLFDLANKKPLPRFPRSIGIITSSTGAAIRDILTVLARRYLYAPIIIYPTLVQGTEAANTIATAIETANRRDECDVIILARGGGSLEDLWPFNEERVARAIHASNLPIITGIGHEVDFTIADFVADQRAATPSAAAELVAPHQAEFLQILSRYLQQFFKIMKNRFHSHQEQIAWIQKHLLQLHPKYHLAERMQRLDYCGLTLVRLQNRLLNHKRALLQALSARLLRQNPHYRITQYQAQSQAYFQVIKENIQTKLMAHREQLSSYSAQLHAMSPLATLSRGYAIVMHEQKIVRKVDEIKPGETLHLTLMEGSLTCSVIEIEA